jgi:hypothetical protein
MRKDALELSDSFLNDVEIAVLKRTTQISASQAVELGLLFSSFGSTELYECLDKIVGKGIDELNSEEYIEALIAFASAEKAQIRPKILSIIAKRV